MSLKKGKKVAKKTKKMNVPEKGKKGRKKTEKKENIWQ